jgi:DNA polymerase-3 subunit alpha
VTERYGDDRVAMIVTYGTIKAKQALKDASRVMGHPFSMGERLTKAMPPGVMGKDIPLSGIFDPEHKRYAEAGEFRTLYATTPRPVASSTGPAAWRTSSGSGASTRRASSCPAPRCST